MADYWEPELREKNAVSPKITDPDAVTASVEQLLRGNLELQGGGSSSGSIKQVDIVSQSKDQITSSIHARDKANSSGSFEEILRSQNSLHIQEQNRPAYEDPSRALSYAEYNNRRRDKSEDVSVPSNWETQASLDLNDIVTPGDDFPNHWKEVKWFVNITTDGGSTTEARVLQAKHDYLTDSEAPTGTASVDSEWEVLDDALAANSEAIASNGDWYVGTTGMQCGSPVLVLQIQQGSGQETANSYLSADREK